MASLCLCELIVSPLESNINFGPQSAGLVLCRLQLFHSLHSNLNRHSNNTNCNVLGKIRCQETASHHWSYHPARISDNANGGAHIPSHVHCPRSARDWLLNGLGCRAGTFVRKGPPNHVYQVPHQCLPKPHGFRCDATPESLIGSEVCSPMCSTPALICFSQGSSVLQWLDYLSGEMDPLFVPRRIFDQFETPRLLIGPPVGGVLYDRFGFRGPFIFGIAVTVIDLIGRVSIIEHKNALVWGVDTTMLPVSITEVEVEQEKTITKAIAPEALHNDDSEPTELPSGDRPTFADTVIISPEEKPKPLSLVAVIIKLSKSSRALVSILITLIYG